MSPRPALGDPAAAAAAPGDDVLCLRDLRKSFGPTEIIRGVSLEVRTGERHAIIGPNGAGKSTLFHLISGRFPLTSGEILLHREPINGLRPFEINRKGLTRSFQVTNVFPGLSVFENVRCAVLWSFGHDYSMFRLIDRMRNVQARTEEVLERVGLAKRAQMQAGLLTYAEQRALEIGLAVAGQSSVVLLDEPTSGMSASETAHAVELIRTVSVGKTLLMVEHDMSVVFGLADRISVLVYGQIIATDTPQNIRNNKAVQEAYLGSVESGK
jgi:branched-chain amino acid transport system ATP-binding protein